jgi:hypothetical protein
MASLAEELRSAMLERLRRSETISTGVRGRIFDAEPAEVPCAWVGATVVEDGTESVELLATVHIWKRSGEAAAAHLIQEVLTVFAEPPPLDTLKITKWSPDYSEVRKNEERAAYRGIARFRAMVGLEARAASLPR